MRMNITAAAFAVALGISALAGAQTIDKNDLYPNGFTVRAGVALPIDSSLSNVANTFTDLGVDFTLPRSFLSQGDTFLSGDYFFEGWGHDNSAHAFGIMINQRFYSNAMVNRAYYFVGVGAAVVNAGGSGTAFAARAGVGQELGKAIIAELAAYVGDKTGGARINSVTLDLGYRF